MEKKVVIISLLVSLIVSLTINLIYLYGSMLTRCDSAVPSAAPQESGMIQSSPPPSPEVLALYRERANILQQKFTRIENACKAGVTPREQLLKAGLQRDEALLAAWRRELNLPACGNAVGPTETAIRVKALSVMITELEKAQKAGNCALEDLLDARAELVQAQIDLAEVSARLHDNPKWTKSADAIRQSGYPIQEEALKSLLIAEQMGSPVAY